MPVFVVDVWTGRRAAALQEALRMTNEAFAERLGIAVRTVSSWHEKPLSRPNRMMRQLLDTTLEQASEAEQSRFALLDEGGAVARDDNAPAIVSDSTGQALRVAIAAVLRDDDVLIACRRGDDAGGIRWQFPAGIVKPGTSSEQVAVREALAETGVHCAVRESLGSRLHPLSKVYCEYFVCEYLAGEAENLDVVENVDVTWVARDLVTRFIPQDSIYPRLLRVLEGHDDATAS